MFKKATLLTLLAASLCAGANAQAICGFDHSHQQLMQQQPQYQQAVQEQKLAWQQYQQLIQNALILNSPNGIVYEIPVVVHVMHTGGAVGSNYNPSDAQLTGMINYLNATYKAEWAAYPDSLSGGTHFPIQFALAKRDPQCNPTTGIVRVNAGTLAGYTTGGILHNSSNGADEATVKALSNWGNTAYYNIWIVNKIDGADGYSGSGSFVAGYAYFPGAPASLDGTIMLASQAQQGESTLPHEIGHAFSLYHTFEGDNGGGTCPPTTNCATTGDEICDTEPHKRSPFNCPSGTNPCTGQSYNNVTHNIMDYSSCPDRFTPGQRTKWLAGLFNNRYSLLTSLGATALPANPIPTPACNPTIVNTGNTSNVGPRKVIFADMNATTPGGYTGDGNKVYQDFSCQQQANVLIGQTYTLSVKTGFGVENVSVYIDYNNDGTFDPAELVYTNNGTSANQTHSTQYTIPTTGIVTCQPLRMRVVSDKSTSPAPTACGALEYGQAEDYAVIIQGPSNSSSVNLAVTNGGNPSCTGSTITITATTTGNPLNPAIEYFINGVSTGAMGNSFTTAAVANGDIVTAKLYYTGPCGQDTSTSAPLNIIQSTSVAPSVTIALTGGTFPSCPGVPLTFDATPTIGGTAPSFDWQVNGSSTGSTSPTFTSTTLNNGDIVTVVMTSNSTCASQPTATSNGITVIFNTANATANIAITAGGNPTCAGAPITFAATTTNPGTTPSYMWTVNTAPTGVTTPTFTTSTLVAGDVVRVEFTSSNGCVANPFIVSNGITISITPPVTPTGELEFLLGGNPSCEGDTLKFGINATDAGPGILASYFVNNTLTFTGLTYNTTTLQDGDQIYAEVVTSGAGCRTTDSFTTPTIVLTVNTRPEAPFISFIGSNLISDSVNVQWYGPNGIIPGANSQSFHPPMEGDYYAKAVNGGCESYASNTLHVSLLSIGNYAFQDVVIAPNPARNQITIDWQGQAANSQVSLCNATGQVVLHQNTGAQSVVTLDVSALAAGVYFVVLQDANGNTGATQISIIR